MSRRNPCLGTGLSRGRATDAPKICFKNAGAPFEVPGAAIWGGVGRKRIQGALRKQFLRPGALIRTLRAGLARLVARARAADAAQLRGLAEADAADADAAAAGGGGARCSSANSRAGNTGTQNPAEARLSHAAGDFDCKVPTAAAGSGAPTAAAAGGGKESLSWFVGRLQGADAQRSCGYAEECRDGLQPPGGAGASAQGGPGAGQGQSGRLGRKSGAFADTVPFID